MLAEHAAKKAGEKLRPEDNAFLCDVRFSNVLPDLPFDPKSLVYPLDAGQFVRYETSSLERAHKPQLHANKDLGIPIDIMSMYCPARSSTDKQPLAPEDAELCRLVDEVTAQGAAKKSAERSLKLRSAGVRPNVPWLLKTKYIANDLYDPVHKVRGDGCVGLLGGGKGGGMVIGAGVWELGLCTRDGPELLRVCVRHACIWMPPRARGWCICVSYLFCGLCSWDNLVHTSNHSVLRVYPYLTHTDQPPSRAKRGLRDTPRWQRRPAHLFRNPHW
jgi:hypothetical protein